MISDLAEQIVKRIEMVQIELDRLSDLVEELRDAKNRLNSENSTEGHARSPILTTPTLNGFSEIPNKPKIQKPRSPHGTAERVVREFLERLEDGKTFSFRDVFASRDQPVSDTNVRLKFSKRVTRGEVQVVDPGSPPAVPATYRRVKVASSET